MKIIATILTLSLVSTSLFASAVSEDKIADYKRAIKDDLRQAHLTCSVWESSESEEMEMSEKNIYDLVAEVVDQATVVEVSDVNAQPLLILKANASNQFKDFAYTIKVSTSDDLKVLKSIQLDTSGKYFSSKQFGDYKNPVYKTVESGKYSSKISCR